MRLVGLTRDVAQRGLAVALHAIHHGVLELGAIGASRRARSQPTGRPVVADEMHCDRSASRRPRRLLISRRRLPRSGVPRRRSRSTSSQLLGIHVLDREGEERARPRTAASVNKNNLE